MKLVYGVALILVMAGLSLNAYQYGWFVDFFATEYAHYSKLPDKYKKEVLEFKESAKKMGKDVSDLEKLRFKVSHTKFSVAGFGGMCNHGEKEVIFPKEETPAVIIWHELGHCALGYKHSADPKSLMFFLYLPEQILDNQQKATFFNYKNPKEDGLNYWERLIFLIKKEIL